MLVRFSSLSEFPDRSAIQGPVEKNLSVQAGRRFV